MNTIKILFLIFTRIGTTLLMFISPFWGLVITNIADALDVVLMSVLGIDKFFSKHHYQLFDKLLDDLILVVAFITLFIFPIIPAEYMPFAIFLSVLRMVGSITMLLTKKRKILLLTPNFILYYYGIFTYLYLINDYSILDKSEFNLIVLAFFGFNYSQEIVLHFLQLHPWTFTKKLLNRH